MTMFKQMFAAVLWGFVSVPGKGDITQSAFVAAAVMMSFAAVEAMLSEAATR